MAVTFRILILLHLFLLFFISVFPFSSSQGSPQNIEVFYPTQTPPPIAPIPEERPLDSPLPPPQPSTSSSSGNDSNRTIAKAVAATAGSTIVIAAVFFFLIRRYVLAQRGRERVRDSSQPRVPPDEFGRVNGNIKGLIVDENGLDVLYWRQLQNGGTINGFRREVLHVPKDEEEEEGGGRMVRKGSRSKKVEPASEIPLLRGKSSTSHVPPPEDEDSSENMSPLTPPPSSHGIALKAVEKREAPVQSKFAPPSSSQGIVLKAVEKIEAPVQSKFAPPPSMPPQPPPPPNRTTAAPPPPPPPVPAKGPSPPPPPPKKPGGSVTSFKPPAAARYKSGSGKSGETGESSGDTDNSQVKLKPLHWDKVNKKNADHSMVWDKINGGSFKVDDDLMEALFGYVATNKKSPTGEKNTKSANTSSPAQIMILDPRKSQNIAIVLKSLALSRKELLDALNEGQGLEVDTLEKLMRISPTEEEQSQILDFDGDPTRLADAESFLFHILKALPSAFTRLTAMQFRSNYDLEILHMKESLQTLELGCKELRSQRLFMKLLEAILKAGNRMNAGTARGNAQAFNLTSLLKLSDVKSTDGKTTLLHFVVEEVVRSEGKKCFISRSHSLSRCGSSRNNNNTTGNLTVKVDREKEYVTLGLPVVGGLSSEFTNVKKAATIDFNTFSGTCSALAARVAETKHLVLQCMADGKGGFVQEMKGFVDDAEEELNVLKEEQRRVMDNVRRTTEYYQAGASKDHFQVFVIVKDFLGMVDQACVEIARNQQRRKSSIANHGPRSPNSQESRTKMRFPVLPPNFMSDKSRSNSSESDVDS
ncbi:Formin-like protein 7 [Hibiscus syriacus]|uniref:Formin-like protein n=1 Tax=Hibiscus syriacus TaxID=106335 RepID=A0A6A3CNQ3_HIBSY|nr:formin-like protein 4 [Hibiscus syriacus]KAE8730237.1 Formin-like protein 7 [Hibiscus syriacus]